MTPSPKLFGTDGVRGIAGTELTAELALSLGRAAAVQAPADRPQVLVVRDTRESGPMLEAALSAGVAEGGGDALLAGVLPTPAASVLVRRLGLDVGAVVSASHNPWQHNGIKFFGRDGRKLDDELEARIEAHVAESGAPGPSVGRVRDLEGSLDDYVRELMAKFRVDLSGRRVLLDCAHGATYRAAPLVFERLGATVESIGDEPDGRNINEGFGSTHPDALATAIASSRAEVGFAFDGDGDRVIAVDGDGTVRDGDELIALSATHLSKTGELEGGGVAVTVMSNYGFHDAMKGAGIEVATTPVGDRNVSAALEQRGWVLGGEQSGHIIWTEYGPTGDGIAAALLVMSALDGEPLAGAIPMRKLPQVLENVEIADRAALEGAGVVWDAIERENAGLEGRGRVLVRPSGTEALVRVMVEAPTSEECQQVCDRLVQTITEHLT
jgi:phosphoglucosamine mutase